jgi:putative FmdB family regulatory protein
MYEYQCEKCGLIFEAMQKFSESPLTQCKYCGGPVKKLISQTNFTLKGGGWYQQGYASASGPASCSPKGCGSCSKAANE